MLKPALFDRYLEVLGVEPGPPGPGLLAELVSAQLAAAPFENISKLYRLRTIGSTTIPTLGEYLDGIETTPNGPSTTTALADRSELADVVEHRLGVAGDVARTAIRGVDLNADIYG